MDSDTMQYSKCFGDHLCAIGEPGVFSLKWCQDMVSDMLSDLSVWVASDTKHLPNIGSFTNLASVHLSGLRDQKGQHLPMLSYTAQLTQLTQLRCLSLYDPDSVSASLTGMPSQRDLSVGNWPGPVCDLSQATQLTRVTITAERGQTCASLILPAGRIVNVAMLAFTQSEDQSAWGANAILNLDLATQLEDLYIKLPPSSTGQAPFPL